VFEEHSWIATWVTRHIIKLLIINTDNTITFVQWTTNFVEQRHSWEIDSLWITQNIPHIWLTSVGSLFLLSEFYILTEKHCIFFNTVMCNLADKYHWFGRIFCPHFQSGLVYVHILQSTKRKIPEDCPLYNRLGEDFKSHKFWFLANFLSIYDMQFKR
jgi:hypothetical protein